MELGGRFWLGVLGLGIGVAIAAYLIFAFIGRAWYAWGFFGMLLALAVILLGVGFVIDRRDSRKRAEFSGSDFTG